MAGFKVPASVPEPGDYQTIMDVRPCDREYVVELTVAASAGSVGLEGMVSEAQLRRFLERAEMVMKGVRDEARVSG